MARFKIDYGIDLGTTNSVIARMENGKPVIKKGEISQMDTTPSCVHFSKKKAIHTGLTALNNLDKERLLGFIKNDPSLINTFEEFKRAMGTNNVYECKNMERSFTPEELSSEILKALKGYIRDEEINSIVVTVPAKFQGYQKDATIEASNLAGFQHCILLQEPIAASIAYGIDSDKIDGKWIVFDFGGGTFDVALMMAEEGIMKVVDTEGDNHLGGKNIDLAIVDEIIIPFLMNKYSLSKILSDDNRKRLFRNTLKRLAEIAKKNLSPKEIEYYDILTESPIGEDDKGEPIEIDLRVTKDMYESVVVPIFQHAIDITKKLLKNNNLAGTDIETVLMIGGPTFSQALRELVKDQITSNVNVSIDPMIAVAKGAALFASTKDIPDEIQERDNSKIQLSLKYPESTVETEVNFGIRIERDETNEIPKQLFVDINRQDNEWSSGKVEIKDDAEIVSILLESGKSNSFNLKITDDRGTVYPAEPDSFTIISGFKVAQATLPFDLCIEVFDISEGQQQLVDLKGLKKNQPLPAKGSATYQTQKDIRPGKEEDKIKIPIYYGQRGSRAIYNKRRGVVIITGEELPGFLPKGSDVEFSIEVDESEVIKVNLSFPYLDGEIVEKNVIELSKESTISKEDLERELEEADRLLNNLEDEYPELDQVEAERIRNNTRELVELLDKGGAEHDTRDQILNNLQENLKELDKLKSVGEWPKIKQELSDALEHLKSTNAQFGDEKTSQMVKELNEQAEAIFQKEDLGMAKDLSNQIGIVDFAIIDKGAGVALEISMIKGFDDNFDIHDWKDRDLARQLIDDGKNIIIANRATKSNLKPIVGELYTLLPDAKDATFGKTDDELLKK